MPYCNPETNQVEELKIKSNKVTTERVEKSAPVLAESPAAVDLDEETPEDSHQEVRAVPHPALTSLTHLHFAVDLNRILLR